MAWCAALAKLHDTKLMPGVLIGLGLSVWSFYMLDRLIDHYALDAHAAERRQAFSKSPQWMLLISIVLAWLAVAWLALWQIPMGLMWECVGLGLLLLLYLAVIHSGGKHWMSATLVPTASVLVLLATDHWPLSPGFQMLSLGLTLLLLTFNFFGHLRQQMSSKMVKDVMGGMLFALGCTAWTRFTQDGADAMAATLEFWLLGCLFVVNLTGLSSPQIQGRWLALGLGSVGGVWVLVLMQEMPADLGYVAQSCALGFVLMLLLLSKRRSFTPDSYRVCIDLAVLVPVFHLWLRA